MTEDEIERIAEKTAQKMLDHIGIDPSEHKEIRADFSFLRSQRKMYSDIGQHSLKALFTALLLGICAIVWSAIKTGKAP